MESMKTLSQFIAEKGDAEAARLFGVKERTAASWRRMENYPRAAKAQEIVTILNGEIDMAGIYADKRAA